MRALADAVGDGDQSRLLATRGRDQRGLPRELQVEAVVGAADEEDGAEVARADVRGGDHDGRAGGGDHDRDHDVVARFAELAGAPGERAGTCVGDGVGRRLDEVGVELGEAEGLDDLVNVSMCDTERLESGYDVPRGRNP